MTQVEIHVTLDWSQGWSVANDAALREYAASRGYKFTHIVLSEGQHASQPMLTWREKLDEDFVGQILRLREEWKQAGANYGFRTSRIKIEAEPTLDTKPIDAARPLYWEHHVKVRLPASDGEELSRSLEEMESIGRRHDAPPLPQRLQSAA